LPANLYWTLQWNVQTFLQVLKNGLQKDVLRHTAQGVTKIHFVFKHCFEIGTFEILCAQDMVICLELYCLEIDGNYHMAPNLSHFLIESGLKLG
jgi:hypothetical protein